MSFTKPRKAIGLDIGTYAVKAVQLSRSGGRLYVDEVGYARVDRNQLSADPIIAHASAINEALGQFQLSNALVVSALAGQTVVIRYPRITEADFSGLDEAVEREAANNIPYDLSEVFLDWTLLEESDDDGKRQAKVLLVAAKHEVIDSRVGILDAAGVQCGVLGVDSLALADAAEGCDFLRVGETVAMVNIGLTSVSIHFVKDGISNFIRDVSWGSRELVQALAKEMRIDFDEADKILRQPDSQMASQPAVAPEPEKASPEAAPLPDDDDPFGEPGGGSLLDPLDDEGDPLGASLSVSDEDQKKDPRAILAIPLQRLVSELRRSFDYYEHQLYERPVERLLLSGGVAQLPLLRDTLANELGVGEVMVCDPSASALVMGDPRSVGPMLEHPAEFMVAVGLAARGMAEL